MQLFDGSHKLRTRSLLILLLLAYALAFQGSRALWERDEGRYTQVALEMLKGGDWWTPHLYYPETTHFTKPPGAYWAIAAAVASVGHSEWAVRLPNGLAFALTLLLIFGIAGNLNFERRRAWLSVLIYGTFLLPYLAANALTTDTLLCAAETLAAWGFTGAYFRDSQSRRRLCFALMWLGFALAFLIKGPPGLLPLLAFAVFLIARHGWKGISRLFSWPGVLIFVLVGLGWFISQILMRPDLLSYFLNEETLGRITTNTKGRNGDLLGPLRIYLPTLLIGPFPWVYVLGLRRPGRLKRFFSAAAWRQWRNQDPQFLLLQLWFFLPLVVFILSRSRLPLYLLPLFVPLALLLARSAQVSVFEKRRAAASVLLFFWIFCLVGMRFAASRVENSNDASRFADVIRKAVPAQFDEVVFVSARAWYGLGFYLDCGVESVALNSAELGNWHDQRETLRSEILGDSEKKLYIILTKRRGEFDNELRRHNMLGKRIAGYENLDVYRISPAENPVGSG